MTGKITLLLIFILCVYGAKAQVADTTQQYDIFYSSPKTYELAGVRAVGGGENYDEDYLAQMAGLSIGMAVQIPGETITRAIKRLYGHGIFSDVSIAIDKIEGDKVYLALYIKERHKLSKINYVGLKKAEENKIKEKIGNIQTFCAYLALFFIPEFPRILSPHRPAEQWPVPPKAGPLLGCFRSVQ